MDPNYLNIIKDDGELERSFIKLTTTWYTGTKESLHKKQSITFLKRKSKIN